MAVKRLTENPSRVKRSKGRARRIRRKELGTKIVGPASSSIDPASSLDARDAKRDSPDDLGKQWHTARDRILSLQKRMNPSTRPRPEHGWVEVNKADYLAPSAPDSDERMDGIVDRIGEGLIDPPFPFDVLCTLLENSSALRHNIDAMATNIDGFGHRMEPVIDFTKPDVKKKIKMLLLGQRTADMNLADITMSEINELMPDDEEVDEMFDLWSIVSELEKARAETFFDNLNPDQSMIAIRKDTREQLELFGNAGWEIIREDPSDPSSAVSQIFPVPFVNLRLLKSDLEPRVVKMRGRKDMVTFEDVEVEKYFRRYARTHGRRKIYYKQFGDDRIVSRDTGEYFDSIEDLIESEGEEATPANELYHWKIPSPISPYGIPRWIGSILAVLGSRAAEEVNFMYFDNKAIPPMALLVSGGRLSSDSVAMLETHIENEIKGRANFHKILVLEALPSDADIDSGGEISETGKMRIELVPLFGNQMKDALFMDYDAANIKKIGRSFRQPQLLTGETADMNRSTALTAKGIGEEQVYQPERDSFDDVINRRFVNAMGIRFWRFDSNAPVQRFPNDLVLNVARSLQSGALTANEARILLSDAFSMDLPHSEEGWAQLPPEIAKILERGQSQVEVARVQSDGRNQDQQPQENEEQE